MAHPSKLPALLNAPSAAWTAPPGQPWRGIVRATGAFLLGSAIILLAEAGRRGAAGENAPFCAGLGALGALLLMATAQSPWLRRPALVLLLALSAVALTAAVLALVKLLFILVAHGLGFSWSWDSDDSDSESGDSSTDTATEPDDLNSDSGFRAALNRLPGVHLGMGGTTRSNPTSCPGCGRAGGTGPGGLCRSCSW